jgi:hypothetical protein
VLDFHAAAFLPFIAENCGAFTVPFGTIKDLRENAFSFSELQSFIGVSSLFWEGHGR